MNKKKFILLVVVALIITILPLSFISCDKASDEDLIWEIFNMVQSREYANNAVELTQFADKDILYIDDVEGYDKIILRESLVEAGESKYRYMIYDIASSKIVFENTVGMLDGYSLSTQYSIIKEKKIVDSKDVYNFYSPSMDLIKTSDTNISITRSNGILTLGQDKYKLEKNGKFTEVGLQTYTVIEDGFKYFISDEKYVVVSESGKTIYSEDLNSNVQIFKSVGNTLLRQEINEVPITDKKYTYIQDGKKYKVEQKIITLKKNKAKEKKVKDVEYVFTSVMDFSLTNGISIFEEELIEKICDKLIFCSYKEISNENLLNEKICFFNDDLDRVLKDFNLVNIKGISKNRVLVTSSGDYYIYDKEGNLIHDLSNYDVDTIGKDLLLIDNQLYNYNLEKVQEDENKQDLSYLNTKAYTIENEKVEDTDPTTYKLYKYNSSTNKMEVIYDNVREINSSRLVNIVSEDNYQYVLFADDCLNEIKVPAKISTMLSVTKEQYESNAISIERGGFYDRNGKAVQFIKIAKTIDGQTTNAYLLVK